MQQLKVIVGKRQEGKTAELMEAFYKDALENELNMIARNELKGNNYVFISGYSELYNAPMFNDVYYTISEGKDDRGILLTNAPVVELIGTSVLEYIRNDIQYGDTTYYIDNDLITPNDAISLMNEYPNDDIKYSFDIVCTMTKD